MRLDAPVGGVAAVGKTGAVATSDAAAALDAIFRADAAAGTEAGVGADVEAVPAKTADASPAGTVACRTGAALAATPGVTPLCADDAVVGAVLLAAVA